MVRAPLVSVILPVYNREAWVARAIESVLSQTYEPLELIVVDDGSTDGTRDVLERFQDDVILLEQPHGGAYVARNLALRHARGELVAFIGTGLQDDLSGITTLVIVGVITNNSVVATARMAGNLGFDTYVVSDATATFGRRDYDGRWRTAEEVHAMSLANLDGEYARIVTTEEVLRWP